VQTVNGGAAPQIDAKGTCVLNVVVSEAFVRFGSNYRLSVQPAAAAATFPGVVSSPFKFMYVAAERLLQSGAVNVFHAVLSLSLSLSLSRALSLSLSLSRFSTLSLAHCLSLRCTACSFDRVVRRACMMSVVLCAGEHDCTAQPRCQTNGKLEIAIPVGSYSTFLA
jgi:hypothetical protein